MPRGKNAKAVRAHNRSCKNGRTSKNTASGSSNQINGKKYKKGESVENTSYTIRETNYEGKIYYIAYLFISKNQIIVKGIYKKCQPGRRIGGFEAENTVITDPTIQQGVINKFFSQMVTK